MKMNAGVLALVVVASATMLVGFWGCGTGPIEQSYAVQSGAESVNSKVGQKTDLAVIMKEIRTVHLFLVDRLTAGSPEQVRDAAARLAVSAGDIGKYQPAFASAVGDEAAAYKRLAEDVKDYSVEVAKSADANQLEQADRNYARLYMTCNSCHRLFRGQTKPAAPIAIPDLEAPKPPPSGTTPPAGTTTPPAGATPPADTAPLPRPPATPN